MIVSYNGIFFDSDLEVEYYKHLKEDPKVLGFRYHPKIAIQITAKNSYTPDFIVRYSDRFEIVETKGYNPYSKMKDDMIHQVMLAKPENELIDYVVANGFIWDEQKVIYRKIKYLKAYGFVDYDFKNPNTIANKRKEKITELSSELKELRQFKKDTIRYFNLHNKPKLTQAQKEFIAKYLDQFYEEE